MTTVIGSNATVAGQVQGRYVEGGTSKEVHAKGQYTFVLVTLLSCLVLQRFGLPAGSGPAISVAVPIVGLMAGWYLWTGVLALDRRRVGIMLGLVGIALISINTQKNMPMTMVTKTSMASLIYWLGITAFGVLRFTRPMDERVFFGVLIRCLAFVAVCGIAAFLAQFAGIHVFTFQGLVPDRFSMEPLYAVVIPLNGGILKANGFFLVEPSVFSQFMALGLICEWIERRRTPYIVLFLFALFCSASGTGWLIVGSFVAYIGFTAGARGLGVALLFSCVCVLAFVAISFIFPGVTDSLSSRIGEFGQQGSSGNQRFVTPFMVMKQVLDAEPSAFFTGVGPGGVDSLSIITYDYVMNTPVKIVLEYGIFALLLYLALILCNRRTARQNSLLLPVLVLLLFAGGNEHFPPILFPMLLIITVANLTRERASILEPASGDITRALPAHGWLPHPSS